MTRRSSAEPTRRRPPEGADRARRTQQVLDELDACDPGDRRRHDELIDLLIETNMGVAWSIAARYRNRGIADDDLEQVAYVALVRVARAYDNTSGHDFLSYAVPSIRGEVRRHFRDQGWMVRPPRRVQENQARISAVESALTTRLGHPPTVAELARELDESERAVQEALSANGCFTPASLDQVLMGTEASSVGAQLGHDDAGLGPAEARVVLAPHVRRLSDRDRLILEMRFVQDCTQQQIAEEIGVTQMQVSRLLSGLMARLRAELKTGAATRASA
jgi:RNA polymerase sigma-70 factor (sigma-B/F/G subfamily)